MSSLKATLEGTYDAEAEDGRVRYAAAFLELVAELTRDDYTQTDLRMELVAAPRLEGLQLLRIGGPLHTGVRTLLAGLPARVMRPDPAFGISLDARHTKLAALAMDPADWDRHARRFEAIALDLWQTSTAIHRSYEAPIETVLLLPSGAAVRITDVSGPH